MKQLNLGDHVVLNSGGPAMLVVDLAPSRVTVSWRSEDGVEEADFPVACVRPADTTGTVGYLQ